MSQNRQFKGEWQGFEHTLNPLYSWERIGTRSISEASILKLNLFTKVSIQLNNIWLPTYVRLRPLSKTCIKRYTGSFVCRLQTRITYKSSWSAQHQRLKHFFLVIKTSSQIVWSISDFNKIPVKTFCKRCLCEMLYAVLRIGLRSLKQWSWS